MDNSNLTLVCNPFAPIGRSVAALNIFRALREVGYPPFVCDISSRKYYKDITREVLKELDDFLVEAPFGMVNLYIINGDEIETTKSILGPFPVNSYNIIYPAWELEKYPHEWAKLIEENFNEIWVPSKFMENSLRKNCSKPIFNIPHPVNVTFSSFLGRPHFGLPESSFLFLFMFDFRSYISRKNPLGFIEAFERACSVRPFADMRAVVKVSGIESLGQIGLRQLEDFQKRLSDSSASDKIILLKGSFTENEVKNLIRNCDCFVSLHRSEGFGLAIAEAMYLGKPVIATKYSGNLEFMREENSFLVDYDLVPVKKEEYPHYEGQYWAEPNKDQAASYMVQLIDDPKRKSAIGRGARTFIGVNFSLLSIGLKIKQRVGEIIKIISGD
uniref:Glycosyltransferase n=1 Tax=candidate division CPR3 bacterium TaxID=2268181 RepID=A0A7C4M0Z5_UNCC3